MAGNHFKNGDGERSAVPPRSNGAGNAGVPSGSSQNGAGNRTSPGETAMFAALYEQSQKAKQAGRVGRQAFPGGAGLRLRRPGSVRHLRTARMSPVLSALPTMPAAATLPIAPIPPTLPIAPTTFLLLETQGLRVT